ncbi:hypothetical protein EOD42_11975 [Rhodovarius crocodyli]|uniref:Secreted protein n=1 Tax=Rhodovarius crocodyli TaxID=1979269 RepID=A0A437MHJ6_9PROT|nr:hypothetical protein [Rhodovarius crocodyli]RVT97101.1 hypothetical protein EOD42_11975 [Rhodovarius crocodyli]
MFRRFLAASAFAAMAAAATPAFAQCDTTFTLANASGVTIMELYFSSSNNSNWGNDRLGSNVLPAGRQMTFQPRPGGRYDFRAVFENGSSVERRGVDLCSVSTVTVQRGGISAN